MKASPGFSVILIAVVHVQSALGQGNPTRNEGASNRSQDKESIQAASQQLAKAFAEGDANAVAALFTEDAEYQDDTGLTVQGRQARGRIRQAVRREQGAEREGGDRVHPLSR